MLKPVYVRKLLQSSDSLTPEMFRAAMLAFFNDRNISWPYGPAEAAEIQKKWGSFSQHGALCDSPDIHQTGTTQHRDPQ